MTDRELLQALLAGETLDDGRHCQVRLRGEFFEYSRNGFHWGEVPGEQLLSRPSTAWSVVPATAGIKP